MKAPCLHNAGKLPVVKSSFPYLGKLSIIISLEMGSFFRNVEALRHSIGCKGKKRSNEQPDCKRLAYGGDVQSETKN